MYRIMKKERKKERKKTWENNVLRTATITKDFKYHGLQFPYIYDISRRFFKISFSTIQRNWCFLTSESLFMSTCFYDIFSCITSWIYCMKNHTDLMRITKRIKTNKCSTWSYNTELKQMCLSKNMIIKRQTNLISHLFFLTLILFFISRAVSLNN